MKQVEVTCGRTPLSGDRAQTSLIFLEPKKSEIGRRGIASHRLRQAWNRKRRSQFLQLVFFGLSKQVWWDKDSPEKPTQTLPEHIETGDQTASRVQEPATIGSDAVEDRKQSAKTPKCTFSRVVVPIELKHFLESGIALVECPDCASIRTIEPHSGVLRFKPHDKRKTRTLVTSPRWVKRETAWEVVGR